MTDGRMARRGPIKDAGPAVGGTRAPRDTLHLVLTGEAATAALGTALGALLRPGDCVTLSGPLGAGKTALARAMIRSALGDPVLEVPSPSYTLVNVHARPEPDAEGASAWHADLYRLSGPEEAEELGLWEALDTAPLLIEWPERLTGALPARRLEIALAPRRGEGPGDADTRDATLIAVGAGWERLGPSWEALR